MTDKIVPVLILRATEWEKTLIMIAFLIQNVICRNLNHLKKKSGDNFIASRKLKH